MRSGRWVAQSRSVRLTTPSPDVLHRRCRRQLYSTAREEVNVGAAGANYGWPNCEGFSCGANPAYTSPLYDYGHDSPSGLGTRPLRGVSSTAAANSRPQYYGSYFFADYAQNWIKRLTLDPVDGHVTGVFNFEPPDGSPTGTRRHRATSRRARRSALLRRPRILRYDRRSRGEQDTQDPLRVEQPAACRRGRC